MDYVQVVKRTLEEMEKERNRIGNLAGNATRNSDLDIGGKRLWNVL